MHVMDTSIFGSRDEATPWLRYLAAAMLDGALQPVLNVPHAEALLKSVAVLGIGASSEPWQLPEIGRGFTMRAALVAAAEALLERSDPAADGRQWRLSVLALALADELMTLPGADRSDLSMARMRYALGLMTSEPPDRLAAEMGQYRDEALELLTDAHLLVRLAAAAWRLASDGEEALGPVATLLEQDEPVFSARLRRVTVWEPPKANDRSEAALRHSIARFRSLEAVLLPMAEAPNVAAALALVEQLIPRWLGQTVLPLWVDDDDRLTLHGASDLAGQRLRIHGGRSAAANAAILGEVTVQRVNGSGVRSAELLGPDASSVVSVLDRQCAERLGTEALLALPVGAPEPIAVLLMGAGVTPDDLAVVRVHSARWLTRFAGFERQLQDSAAEQRARYTRRMREAVHEISNPLSVIQNYVHLLGIRTDGDAPVQEQIRLISDELRRAASLLRSLTDEERADRAIGEAGDVNALVSDVLALIKSSLGPTPGIEIRFTPGIDLPALAAAHQRLYQVLLNLTRNALEAMSDGGILDVVVDQSINDRGQCGIEIRVSDTGEGIAPTLLGHIFESGVSVKGEGRGLGLAITSRLVQELGGEISCRSRLGAGTSFLVWLPAV